MQSGYPETPGLTKAVQSIIGGYERAEKRQEEQAARARINAAAPEILASLKALLIECEKIEAERCQSFAACDDAPAVIVKAEGREG